MKIQNYFPFFLISLLLFVSCKNNSTSNENKADEALQEKETRIISLNGAITEIITELGYADKLVGRDVTSTYPEIVKDSVKDLGHVRSINMESIMELNPTMILASDRDMNADLKKSLSDSGIEFKLFDQKSSVEGTKALIKEIGDYLGHSDTQRLLDEIDKDLSEVKNFDKKPNVLFIYARGAGTIMVAGGETPMENMIELAGGKNTIDSFKDFKPLTGEAIVENNPDVILLFDSGLKSLGGKNGLLKAVPEILETRAGKNKSIIAMDGALLSDFGPRVGKATSHLNALLQPYAK